MSRETVALRLDGDLVRRLNSQAERRMVSRNYLVTRAVTNLLNELEDTSDWIDNEANA